jgi:hypothetical protein
MFNNPIVKRTISGNKEAWQPLFEREIDGTAVESNGGSAAGDESDVARDVAGDGIVMLSEVSGCQSEVFSDDVDTASDADNAASDVAVNSNGCEDNSREGGVDSSASGGDSGDGDDDAGSNDGDTGGDGAVWYDISEASAG